MVSWFNFSIFTTSSLPNERGAYELKTKIMQPGWMLQQVAKACQAQRQQKPHQQLQLQLQQHQHVARSSISVSQLTFYVTSDTNFTTFAMCFMPQLLLLLLLFVACGCCKCFLWTTIRAELVEVEAQGFSPIGVQQMHVPRLSAQFCLG